MADEKKTLPKFPENRWWQLRRKFLQTLPKTPVDAKYLSTIFDIGEKAAGNLVPALRQLGLIDDQGKPTELANEWRHNDTYPAACKKMLEAVYPDGLRDVQPAPPVDRSQAASWFTKQSGIGLESAKQLAALYALIVEADASKEGQEPTASAPPEQKAKSPKPRSHKGGGASKELGNEASPPPVVKEEITPPDVRNGGRIQPTVHLDVQIHISPDATNDQIEKIFEAMGKHVFNRGKGE